MSREYWYRGAVVTGAGSGIGRALALQLASRGVSLVLADIDEEGLAETATRTRARGAETRVQRCDVSSPDQIAELAEFASAALPSVDLLFNNAGVLVAGSLLECSIDDYRHVLDVNLWGVIHGSRAFAPLMIRAGRGHIVNTASVAASIAVPSQAL